jgi:hypothetical protein
MSLLRNGFCIILKLKNNLGITNYNIPKYDNYNIEIINSININVFLFPSYLPSIYKMILNKKNTSSNEDVIYIKYILMDKKIE